jgi:hypothetical protein
MTHLTLPPAGTASVACFLDETGVVAQDRYFAVGVLTVPETSDLPTQVRKYRQRNNWTGEWHFSGMNEKGLRVYRGLVDLLRDQDGWSYTLTLADRSVLDVVEVCGDRYVAYERISAQSVSASMVDEAQAVVLADEYSTPDTVRFEEDVRWCVNSAVEANVVAGVIRVTSDCHDLMQVSDVITGALIYPYRQGVARMGKRPSAKRRLSSYVQAELAQRVPVTPFDPAWLSVKPRSPHASKQ